MDRLPEIVEFYIGQITEALATHADIVVHTGNGGPSYVRKVDGRNEEQEPRTLMIGPVSISEMEQLRAYIRSRLTGTISSTILGPDQITALDKQCQQASPKLIGIIYATVERSGTVVVS